MLRSSDDIRVNNIIKKIVSDIEALESVRDTYTKWIDFAASDEDLKVAYNSYRASLAEKEGGS